MRHMRRARPRNVCIFEPRLSRWTSSECCLVAYSCDPWFWILDVFRSSVSLWRIQLERREREGERERGGKTKETNHRRTSLLCRHTNLTVYCNKVFADILNKCELGLPRRGTARQVMPTVSTKKPCAGATQWRSVH
jgi:hypothetical protein